MKTKKYYDWYLTWKRIFFSNCDDNHLWYSIDKFAYQLMFLALKLLFLCKILRAKQYVSTPNYYEYEDSQIFSSSDTNWGRSCRVERDRERGKMSSTEDVRRPGDRTTTRRMYRDPGIGPLNGGRPVQIPGGKDHYTVCMYRDQGIGTLQRQGRTTKEDVQRQGDMTTTEDVLKPRDRTTTDDV